MANVKLLPESGEIQPASMAQIIKGKNGHYIEVDDDVGNVVRDLQEIDNRLRVRYSEAGDYFVVYMREDDMEPGDGYLVTTAEQLDARLVNRIRRISHESYDFSKEVQAIDRQADKEREHAYSEHLGEIAERLAHALRKDRGFDQWRAYIPKDLPAGSEESS